MLLIYTKRVIITFFLMTLLASSQLEAYEIERYDQLLSEYVDQDGLVNYKGLKNDLEMLEGFVASLSELTIEEFNMLEKNEQIAYFINAYNAITLMLVAKHYPIKPSFIMSLFYPKNSIRQIDGIWDKFRFKILDKNITLNDIENNRLRVLYNEPKIHMALVCASMGCPHLRNEAYRGDRLQEQLEDQTKKFFSDESKFYFDAVNELIFLSPIFKWFQDDFEQKDGVIPFLIEYVPNGIVSSISGKTKIKWLPYDWELNEQT